jgi:hypothetical protein
MPEPSRDNVDVNGVQVQVHVNVNVQNVHWSQCKQVQVTNGEP